MKTDRVKNQETPFFIVSAQKGRRTIKDISNAYRLESLMQNRKIKYKIVTGFYAGREEVSYIVNAIHKDFVLEQAKQYDQDVVLFVDEYRNGQLWNTDGEVVAELGKYKRAGRNEPEGNWTYDIATGEYWQTEIH